MKKNPGKEKEDDFELVHGSGNVFRDLGLPNPDIEQLRAILAAKIIGILDDEKLTVRKAEKITGIAASDFSRIRNVKLDRFTIDRMLTILTRLNQDFAITITAKPRKRTPRSVTKARATRHTEHARSSHA